MALTVPKCQRHEATRVAAAKILVALLPKSMLVLKRLLKKNRPIFMQETHFSLFCYLDEVQHCDCLKSASKSVLKLISTYLMERKDDSAQACWMAADLLGDHWLIRDSLLPLVTAAQKAKFPSARAAAINGLSKALRRCSAKDRNEIKFVLEWLSKHDPNEKVRSSANVVIKESMK